MLKLFLASVFAIAPAPGLCETLLSGATYFDSENTLVEVQKLIKERNQDGLVRLFQGKHISSKTTQNMDIILLLSGVDGESPAEFRFPSNPTTYWTFSRNVSPAITATPALSPNPSPPNLLSDLAGPTPTPTPSPIPTPTSETSPTSKTPMPKSRVAVIEAEDDTPEPEPSPPLRKHARAKKKYPPAKSTADDGVPENAKVWHQVNGHWKWYDKRNYREVRKAIPVPTATPTP